MKINVELHTHTNYSHDSNLFNWLYLIMLKLKNINAVAITDHNEVEGAIKFKKFLKKHGIEVIVGEEIFTTKGEIIGLFIKEKINPGLSPRETMLKIKEQSGLVYIPHPYDEKRYKTVLVESEISANLDLIDIIEIHNGRNIKDHFSEKQLEIAEKYKKVKSVGSDAHTFFELGRNYISMLNFNTSNEFYNNLKDAQLTKAKCLPIAHQVTKVDRIIKLIGKGNINELCRIVYKKYRRRHAKSS